MFDLLTLTLFLDVWSNGSINNHYLSTASLQAVVNAHYIALIILRGRSRGSEDRPVAVVCDSYNHFTIK